MDKLTNEMIKDLAIRLGLEPALLKAVQLVEAAGRDGFLADGRPQILFEGHIMYKEVHTQHTKKPENKNIPGIQFITKEYLISL